LFGIATECVKTLVKPLGRRFFHTLVRQYALVSVVRVFGTSGLMT